MKKKLFIVGAVILIVVIGAGTVAAKQHNDSNPAMATVAEAQKSAQKDKPACRTDNKSNLHLSARDAQDIDMAGVSYLTDVPAGTNVDVRVTDYDGNSMSGASIYPSKYGSYNFEATKIAGATVNQISWKVTHFAACK